MYNMAAPFIGSKDNPLLRECDECGDTSVPAFSPGTTCDKCITDKQYAKLNESSNKTSIYKKFGKESLAHGTIGKGIKKTTLRKRQYIESSADN